MISMRIALLKGDPHANGKPLDWRAEKRQGQKRHGQEERSQRLHT